MANIKQIQTGGVVYNLKDQQAQDAISVNRSSPIVEGNGYVQSSDGTLVQATGVYNYSALMEVEEGEKYKYKAIGSSSVLIVAAYGDSEGDAIIEKSVQGVSPATLLSGIYTVPAGVKYIRITSSGYYDNVLFKNSFAAKELLESVFLQPGTNINELTECGVYQCLNNSFSTESAPPANSHVGNLVVTKDSVSGIIYQTFVESYTGYVYTRIKRATGWDEWAASSTIKKKISILFVGNSLTQDGIAYLPYLLKNYYPEFDFKFYMWYNGGKTLEEQYEYFENDTPCDIFSVAENNAYWTNYNSSKTMSEILSTYKFDVVCMQEYFNFKESYTDTDLADWENCKDYIEENYEGDNGLEFISLFHAPKRDAATTVFGRTLAGNNLILQKTIADDMIPNGIAVYRALSTDLDNLGDQGHLSPDGTHTQEGLPCLLQTYVTACWLFDRVGLPRTIYGCPLRMTTAIYNTINVPGANLGSGVITGTDEQNLLAQEVAIKAYKEGKKYVESELNTLRVGGNVVGLARNDGRVNITIPVQGVFDNVFAWESVLSNCTIYGSISAVGCTFTIQDLTISPGSKAVYMNLLPDTTLSSVTAIGKSVLVNLSPITLTLS